MGNDLDVSGSRVALNAGGASIAICITDVKSAARWSLLVLSGKRPQYFREPNYPSSEY